MKPRLLLGKILVAAGLLILFVQGGMHFYAASRGSLRPFDEDGERVFVPFVGTVCLGSGIFLLALSGGRKDP